MIPVVLDQEKESVKRSIQERHVSICYDGCSRLGEALVLVVRFVDDQWTVHQLLARLKVLAKTVNGEELAVELIPVVPTFLQIKGDYVIAVRDGAAVNGAAMRILKAVYPKVFDVTCFFHALDLVGNRFELPTLDCFMQFWTRLFAHSCAANFKWKERTGTCIRSFFATR